MAPTLPYLETDRSSFIDKLNNIQFKVFSHAKNPLKLQKAKFYLEEIRKVLSLLDLNYTQIRNLSPENIAEHKVAYTQASDTGAEVASRLMELIEELSPPAQADTTVAVNTQLAELIQKLIPTSATRNQNQPQTNNSAHMYAKLPKLELPTFDGNILEWTSFKDSFDAAVDTNQTLTDVQKFNYLKTLLKGEPARQIAALALTDANYAIAVTQLKDRYDNKRKITSAIFDKFLSQARCIENAKATKALVDAGKSCLSGLENCGYTIDTLGQPLLVYLLLSKFSPEARTLWEHEHKSNAFPKFDDIISFLERHASAIEESTPQLQPRWEIKNVHHVTPNDKKQDNHHNSNFRCNIGCKESHKTSQCDKFRKSTVEERRSLVNKNHLCFNCLSNRHQIKECKFDGSCRKCSKKHHPMLHMDASPTQGEAKVFHTVEAEEPGEL